MKLTPPSHRNLLNELQFLRGTSCERRSVTTGPRKLWGLKIGGSTASSNLRIAPSTMYY